MVRFDYTSVDWCFAARILDENNRRLSRSRQGVSDTSTSREKHPLRLLGDALRARVAANEERVHRLLFERRQGPPPAGPDKVQDWLWTIADMTNEGLLPAGRLRTWAIESRQRAADGREVSGPQAKVPPADLERALAEFCAEVHRRWGELAADPVPLAAWAEWELNGGRLHPFYDGCGRISRSFGAGLLLAGSCLLPLYDNSASYFEHGNRGPAAFVDYVRERIVECSRWTGGAS